MDLGLEGKKALITGARRGLGYAAARGLALEGADVAINARDGRPWQLPQKSWLSRLDRLSSPWLVTYWTRTSLRNWFLMPQNNWAAWTF